MPNTAAILLGGGKSTRMAGFVDDKIVFILFYKPVFAYSIEAFIKSKIIDTLVIVYKDLNQKEIIQNWLIDNDLHSLNILWTQGGERRQDSVLAGLQVLPNDTSHVLIHDMARPLIKAKTLKKIHRALQSNEAVTLAHRMTDTIKQVPPHSTQKLIDLDRKTLWAMETPQAFKYPLLLKAYEKVEKENLEITDDIGAFSLLEYPIKIIENSHPNLKITVKNDIDYIEFLLAPNHVFF